VRKGKQSKEFEKYSEEFRNVEVKVRGLDILASSADLFLFPNFILQVFSCRRCLYPVFVCFQFPNYWQKYKVRRSPQEYEENRDSFYHWQDLKQYSSMFFMCIYQ
jgi:hypothetical protein